MKLLLTILLLIVGVFAQKKDTSKVIPLEITSKSQCYQNGFLAGNKFSAMSILSFSLGLCTPLAPIAHFTVGKTHPKPSTNIVNDFIVNKPDDDCYNDFLKGYERGSIKMKQSSVIIGGAILPAWFITAMFIGGISSGFIN
jgi:hypothetical protein